MKKVLLLVVSIIMAASLVAQDINTIIKKHEDAINAKKLNSFKTMKIIGTFSQMGMAMDMTLIEKAPDKVKTVVTFNGMEIVTVVNGDKGYMINPMMGSAEPTPMAAADISQSLENKMLGSSIRKQMEIGKLELVGEEDYNGTKCYKLKSETVAGNAFLYIDAKSFLNIAVKLTTVQMGQEMGIEMRMSDFRESEGVLMAMTTETYMNGEMTGTLVYKSIEFDLTIDDSVFEVK